MSKRVLSIFALTMINVVALADVRSLPISAEYGWALITYTLFGAVFFLLPCALIVSELATTWPKMGGAYIWVREAFGRRWGFLLVWIQWVYNIVWYPTIMTVLAVTFFYLVSPQLIQNKILMLSLMVLLFWLVTLANCFGMRISSLVSTVGTLVGVILPLIVLVCASAAWLLTGHHSVLPPIEKAVFFPSNLNLRSLAFLTAMLFSFVGIEMSSTHAQEVKSPARDYPRACLLSGLILTLILILGGLSVAGVVPHNELGITQGVIQSFAVIFSQLGLNWVTPIMGICIIVGGFSGVAAWVLGTSKSMMVAGQDGSLPKILSASSDGIPRSMLITQAVVFTVLCSGYFLFDSITASYWLLSAMTSELALFFYVLLFSSAIYLRFKFPEKKRPFQIPGGRWGIVLVSLVALGAIVFTFAVGLLPPTQIHVGSVFRYESILLGGILIVMAPGVIISCWKWRKEN